MYMYDVSIGVYCIRVRMFLVCLYAVYLCVCLFVYPSACLSVCKPLFGCLSVSLPVCLHVCLTLCLSYIAVCMSLFACLPAYLSVCLFVCVFLRSFGRSEGSL